MATQPKPKPVVQVEVCSICGLDWKRHIKLRSSPDDVTMENCIELLKAELAKKLATAPMVWSETTSGLKAMPQHKIHPISKEGTA